MSDEPFSEKRDERGMTALDRLAPCPNCERLRAALRDILTCIEYPHHHAGAEYVNVICVTCKDVARAALTPEGE